MNTTLHEGLEFYWPGNTRLGVNTILRIYESSERRYGQLVPVAKVDFIDDYNTNQTWRQSELEDSFVKGYTALFKGNVPRKARKKLNDLALSGFTTYLNPTDFLSFDVDGTKVNVGITTWTKNLVGAVGDDGRTIRKQSILKQIAQYLAQIS